MQKVLTKEDSIQVLGKSLKRKEDPRLLRGAGTYVDDIRLPGMLYAHVSRSPYGHARINSLNINRVLADPDVRLVYTGRKVSARVPSLPLPSSSGGRKPVPHPLLAKDIVKFAGEGVAFIVAETEYSAEDASELVEVDYSPLECLMDPDEAMKVSATPIHEDLTNNIGNHYLVESGNVEQAFEDADRIIKFTLFNQRVAPCPIEPRVILASFDPGTKFLTVWISNQQPFETRAALSSVLGINENNIRVIVPDVGGAFGAKVYLYPEDVLVCLATMDLGKPVKWVESRSENFATMVHGRGQKQIVEAAVKLDGRILGLNVRIISDSGAYPSPETFVDPEFTVKMIPALYDLKAFRGELFCVHTNKMNFDSYRGAGRPESTYLIERTMDRIARELGMDPVDVRARNFVEKSKFPFKSATGYIYDSGDYETNMKRALEFANYDRWRIEQKRERRKKGGKLIGLGISTYLEINAFGPDFPQTASLTVTSTGKAKVISGTTPQGQGHETAFAQIVAEELGIDFADVRVAFGDTESLPWGTQTGGSRSGAIGGSAVLISARKIKMKMQQIAAKHLAVDPDSLVFRQGKIFDPKKRTEKSISFVDIASMAYQPSKLPAGMEASLFAYTAFSPLSCAFPFGTHIAVVEVDIDTGIIHVIDYVAVDDIGEVLNPMIAEGQVHGGVTQGASQALFEQVSYDNNGQLLTRSFSDYQIPTAQDILPIRWFRTNTPTEQNPLGAKGIGENGTVAATPAIVNAVEDALAHYEANAFEMPLKPDYVMRLVKDKKELGLSTVAEIS